MNYIISGGLGFIGKNLTLALDRANKIFMVLDKLTGCDLNTCEIRIPNCDRFIHLAACTNIRESMTCPEKFIVENVNTTTRCLNYTRQTGAHFILASSMGAPQALSPYSASKLACESICNAYRESFDVKVTVLRFSSVYGSHSLSKSSVIASFIKNCLRGEDLIINGTGEQARDFVHVDDVVDTILNCDKFVGYKTINVCTGIMSSVIDIANYISDLSENYTNFKPKIVHKVAIKGEVTETEPKSDIEPKIEVKEGIKRTFKWYMEHYKC